MCKENKILEALRVAEQNPLPLLRDEVYHLLQACSHEKDLSNARRIHSLMAASNLHAVSVLSDHLIRLFGQCQSLQDACDAFSLVPKRTVFTWNAISSAHMNLLKDYNALLLYAHMQKQGVNPNKVTFLFVLKACSNLNIDALEKYGRVIHHQILFLGNFSSEVAISNMLIHMYAKCGCLREARSVFCGSDSENLRESGSGSRFQRDSISWSALISGYAQQGQVHEALNVYSCMQRENVPNSVTFICILKACGNRSALDEGRRVHKMIVDRGLLEKEIVLATAIVDMYAKCGEMTNAKDMLNSLSVQDVISWNTLISGYIQAGQCSEALDCMQRIYCECLSPDSVTFICILKACGTIGGTNKGKQIHDKIRRRGLLEKDVTLGNALFGHVH